MFCIALTQRSSFAKNRKGMDLNASHGTWKVDTKDGHCGCVWSVSRWSGHTLNCRRSCRWNRFCLFLKLVSIAEVEREDVECRRLCGCFPKIGVGPQKWMVKIMENPMNKWMIWGVFPYFWFNTHVVCQYVSFTCETGETCFAMFR